MKHMRKIIGLIVLLGLVLVPGPSISTAQTDDDQRCPAITLQALEATRVLCDGTAQNEVCYGHVKLEASPQPNVEAFKFDIEGDTAAVADVASLRLSAMDTSAAVWGVALMRLQVNLLDQLTRKPVMMLLFGDVEITNLVDAVPSVTFPVTVNTGEPNLHARVRSAPNGLRIAPLADGETVIATGRSEDGQWTRIMLDNERLAWMASFLLDAEESFDTLDVVGPRSAIFAPMQAFYMESAANDAPCPEAPNSGLLIQTLQGAAQVTFLINEVDIQLDSTVFIQATAGQELIVSVVDGSASVTAQGVTEQAIAGSQISVPLDEDGAASGAPSPPRAYEWGSVVALPTSYMDEPVEVAAPISETVAPTATARPTVPPPGPDPTPPPPPPEPDTVIVCHRGTTITISIGALDAFLNHGDTLGPCPK